MPFFSLGYGSECGPGRWLHRLFRQCAIQVKGRVFYSNGYFNKVDFGDKGAVMLILFGAPVSYENNQERALNFLLELREKTDITWRAGVTYGTVYAGIMGGEERCEYTAIGDIVNTSARIMMLAQWNNVLLSDSIAEHRKTNYEKIARTNR